MPPPYSVRTLEVTDSTQDDARVAFVGTPILVVAARQRQGRGRTDAAWETAPRALATSLAFEPGWRGLRASVLPLVAGVAAARATGARLKWPNDVMIGDAKAGGILVEAGVGLVVAGLGLNLWWDRPPPGWAALHERDPGPERARALAEHWARELLSLTDAPEWPRQEYLALCDTIGRDITWTPDGAGRAVGLASDGGLIVDTGDGVRTIRAGAVRHVR